MTIGYRELGARLSNWGRWGEDDQLGTLNWITPQKVARAATLVRSGEVVGLGLPLDRNGPQVPGSGRVNPVHIMVRTGQSDPAPSGFHYTDDMILMYPQSATQIDALAHVAYDGFFYNGHDLDTVDDSGAASLGVEVMKAGIHGRGVLVDLPRYFGVPRLSSGQSIGPKELDGCLRMQGISVEEGDVLLVRTGWMQVFRTSGARAYLVEEPGLALESAEWLHRHRVSMVASDNWGIEVVLRLNAPDEMPLHCVLVRDMGMPLGEMLDLEELASRCAALGRWTFWFEADPLHITGGVGSPLEPKAIL